MSFNERFLEEFAGTVSGLDAEVIEWCTDAVAQTRGTPIFRLAGRNDGHGARVW